jgi:hypothetical protein
MEYIKARAACLTRMNLAISSERMRRWGGAKKKPDSTSTRLGKGKKQGRSKLVLFRPGWRTEGA